MRRLGGIECVLGDVGTVSTSEQREGGEGASQLDYENQYDFAFSLQTGV